MEKSRIRKRWRNIQKSTRIKPQSREKPKSFIELRACWQLVKPDGWNNADIRGDCFMFDYPAAWKKPLLEVDAITERSHGQDW